MERRPRRNHSPAFKAKVAVAAIKDEQTLIELAQDFDLHPNQIKQWRDQLLKGATGVFGDRMKAEPEPVIDVKTLQAKIGDLTLENDFCPVFIRRARQGGSVAERKNMIALGAPLSVSRQAVVLSRSACRTQTLSVSGMQPISGGNRSNRRTLGFMGAWMLQHPANDLPDELLLGALGANPYWARNWLLFGQETKPVIGAVLIFARRSGGHVGVAVGQDDTHFFILGGNQSDSVTVTRIAKSRLPGARWPLTYPPRLQRLPTMKPGEFLTTTDEIRTGKHHAETRNSGAAAPNPDRLWHRPRRQRACPGFRCRAGDRRAADHRVAGVVSYRQTGAMANLKVNRRCFNA